MSDNQIYAGTGSSFPEQIIYDKTKKCFAANPQPQPEPLHQAQTGNAQPQNNAGNSNALSSLMPMLTNMFPKNAMGSPIISSLLSGKQPSPTELISTLMTQQQASGGGGMLGGMLGGNKKEVVQAAPLPLQKLNLEHIKSVDNFYNET